MKARITGLELSDKTSLTRPADLIGVLLKYSTETDSNLYEDLKYTLEQGTTIYLSAVKRDSHATS